MKIDISDYKPYKGFYDLRKFDLLKRLFRRLWQIQDMLFEMNNNREYYRKWHPNQWQRAQELSAHYQRLLFKRGRK